MHVADKWNMGSIADLQQFISQNGFAVLVSANFNASHVPLLIASDEGEMGVLYGHLARSNAHAKTISGEPVLAIFSGPHSYISPTWYAATPAVPTWNYGAVHAVGTVELTSDEKTLKILEATIKKYEPELLQQDNIMPEQYKSKLAKAIVGFKIVLTKIQGQDKLGQHRKIEDQQGVVAGLSASTSLDAQQLLNYMQQKNIGMGV
ncbi:transcriptional regulator [Thalassotalea sp. 42_200_T64]|nr:transcriptional regulator [Thalassotalea sp. 42_200_T64]